MTFNEITSAICRGRFIGPSGFTDIRVILFKVIIYSALCLAGAICSKFIYTDQVVRICVPYTIYTNKFYLVFLILYHFEVEFGLATHLLFLIGIMAVVNVS
jgi:hypothetical protein